VATRGSGARLKRVAGRSRGLSLAHHGVTFDLARHGGKWVATQRGSIIAARETLEALERFLDEAGIGYDIVMTKVPKSGDLAL
jgi:hypothetical protein